ncbi:hypothetical protein JYT83_00600 [bacterium AH-315-F18]|nr:hypothetical protein [bacterium AH-315-F18]
MVCFVMAAVLSWPLFFLPSVPSAEIVVDLRQPKEGRVGVEMIFHGLVDEEFFLDPVGKEPGYTFSDLTLKDGQGKAVAFTKTWRRHHHHYNVQNGPYEKLVLRYTVTPGGNGRHGKQGALTGDFALLDGRIFMLPEGGMDLARVRIRFIMPQGWTAHMPFSTTEGGFVIDDTPALRAAKALVATGFSAGRMAVVARKIGETELRVVSLSAWPAEARKQLVDRTQRLYEYFHKVHAFDPGGIYQVSWVPRVDDQRVFGGSFSNGVGLDRPEQEMTTRAWELVAHRLAHALNKYVPTGLLIRHPRDHWLIEGWASFNEEVATRSLGLVEPGHDRWNFLYSRYLEIIQEYPERDVPLAQEPFVSEEIKDFLHYVKGPLVAKLLDAWLQKHSGKSLEAFMAAMWPKYGGFRSVLPVRTELEGFAGVPLDDFWALFVDGVGAVTPVWPAPALPRSPKAAPPARAAQVGDVPISGDYLYYLAARGGFVRFSDVRSFVVASANHRLALKAKDAAWVPDEIRAGWFLQRPESAFAIARMERQLIRRLGGSAIKGTLPMFKLNTDSVDGRNFAKLLALEGAYDRSLGAPSGAVRITIFPGGGKGGTPGGGLVVGRDQGVTVKIRWLQTPLQATCQLLAGKRVLATERRKLGPDNKHCRFKFRPEDRLGALGVLRFRIQLDEAQAIERAFWQR